MDVDRQDLRNSGELVFQRGLADGSTAKTVSLQSGVPVTTDGPFAESKGSLIGYWVVDVESESRAIEIAGWIAAYAPVVEVRQAGEASPDL
ncbi:MAG TPA: YciI family protein [Jiangellaceae bacterium]|nr:YciI family protein [Jiangellaceae bacterium]